MTLTKGDLKNIGDIVDRKLDLRLEKQKTEIESLLIEHRSQFFNKIDPILEEVQTEPQERAILSSRLDEHDDRITALEKTKVQ